MAWLASFPENNPLPITEVDSSGHLTYINPEAEQVLPGLAEQGRAHPWLAGLAEFAANWPGGATATREVKMEDRWYLQTLIPIPPDHLRVYGVEITARRQAEEALRESEEQFRTLAESISNLAWWANGDGYITWYNRRWYEYTGTTPEQMEGWGWQSVHDPEALPRVLEQWRTSIATGEPFDMTFPLRGADGVFRPFLTRVQPLKDSAGRVVALVRHEYRRLGAEGGPGQTRRGRAHARADGAGFRERDRASHEE